MGNTSARNGGGEDMVYTQYRTNGVANERRNYADNLDDWIL